MLACIEAGRSYHATSLEAAQEGDGLPGSSTGSVTRTPRSPVSSTATSYATSSSSSPSASSASFSCATTPT